MVLLGPAAATALPEAGSWGDVVAALARQPDSARTEATAERFVVPVADAAGRRRATKLLMRTNWRPHDGIIARVLNKHISVPISQRLADVPVTPNQMTIVAALFALVGVALTARGSYASFLLGASLVQVQSILDGCDGELARMRYQSSRLGAWLDTIVDDVIGVLWVFALGVGAARATGSWLYGLAGGVGALLYFVSTGYVFFALFRAGASSHAEFVWFFEEGSDPAQEYPDLRKVSTWLKYSVRRVFTVLLFFALSLFGLIRVALVLALVGALGWFTTAMIQIGKRGLRIKP
jgi:phosphatidylglycerophosphate synthase